MKFKGTKGKWKCIADENYSDAYQLVCKPNSSTFGEQEYNVRLIETAPELLEALKDFVLAIESNKVILAEEYENAKKVIEKATKIESL